MSAAYLAPLERRELDELIRVAEHAERVAHIALNAAPLRFDALADACGVAQDVMCLLHDAYDASMLLSAAEMDRVFDLGGDNDPPEYQPDEDNHA